jgi:dipeptide transport system substrate-binding protein
MGQLGWTGDNGDPDNFFFLLGCDAARIGGQNITKWCNKEFDEDLKKARTLSDTAERTKLYMRMQEIVHDEAPAFLIAHSTVYEPIRKNVVGYKVSPLGRHQFDAVDLQ